MSTALHYKSNFFNFFPTPLFLEMPSVGIDVSDQAVRFMQIVRSPSEHMRFHIKCYGEKKIPEGVITGGFINQPEEIKKILAQIQKEHRFKFASISLPEEKGYLFKMQLPNVEEKYVSENIELRLDENVPVDATKSVFDYNIIHNENSHSKDAVVTVVPNKVIDAYSDLFQAASMTPISCELVTQAVARSVIPIGEKQTILIINVGDMRTGFGIISNGFLQFTSTVNIGRVSEEEDVDKRLSLLKDEIAKLKIYWQSRIEGEDQPIKKVIISGKAAVAPGLKEYLSTVAGCPVELANVWVNVLNFDEQIPEISFEDSLDYAPAIGLALLRFQHA